ncbi:MAG: Uma2 family endonuclease [Candidatus Competibacteraceae bacterium]|nr:Uma2 family endonuclease [Candidatus Competibacteraceae bacterium]
MQTAALQQSLYESLMRLPENVVGEIIAGQLHTQPRPAGPHALASSVLNADIGSAFHRGRGGPGGWWILIEPEVHFVRDTEVLVPDLAGWRRERMLHIPKDQRFEVVPDWVCEILSPSTAKKDRILKMPTYARYGVPYLWLVDPLARTLEAFALEQGRWTVIGLYADEIEAAIPPFQEISLPLGELWVAE